MNYVVEMCMYQGVGEKLSDALSLLQHKVKTTISLPIDKDKH